jgi:predicted TPR repeat methyltransferase
MRTLAPDASIDCLDLNPRVVRSVRKECDSAFQADVAVQRSETRYDLIVATNILLYLNEPELLLAMQNIRAMLLPGGVFIHNDARFQTNLFGRAVGLPALHLGMVTIDSSRLIDHFVIHAPGEPKL